MYDRVLVPTDGSDGTEAVLEHATAIAEPHDAAITALYVVDARMIRSATDTDPDDVREELESAGTDALERARSVVEASGVTADTILREGTPVREILTASEEIDADLVVMGSHGKTPREKVQGLGSVSEGVVTNADRPVLVVRLP
ncbi:MAG: universal stress protein [Halanaeroarchaeum sp.]